jgi:phosphoribosylformylglycinamidine cyclo-ligase
MADETYKAAGVDRDAAEEVRRRIKAIVAPTHGPQVLGGIGGFGAMYELAGYREPVLVSSTDGVGTKVKLATALGRYEGLGEDLVNACVNDVIVCGAKPLFFLDYVAVGKLHVDVVETLVSGMTRACGTAGCALIGGETAEMPGVYGEDEFDLAGFAVGVVEKSAILDPSTVAEGDILIGIPSSGLHTNGYALVRDMLALDDDPAPLMEFHPELGSTLGEALLEPHRPYYPQASSVLGLVKTMAHITGGGLIENVPRALPDGLGARFDTASWDLPPIFTVLQERSNVARNEMYRVFNMGLGLVMVCDRTQVEEVRSRLPEARVVGEVVTAAGDRRVVL